MYQIMILKIQIFTRQGTLEVVSDFVCISKFTKNKLIRKHIFKSKIIINFEKNLK